MIVERERDVHGVDRIVTLRSNAHRRTAVSYDSGKTWSLFDGGNFPRIYLAAGPHIVMQRFARRAANRWIKDGSIDTRWSGARTP